MTEEWRPVVGFEGLYEVSSLGRVRSLPREASGRLYGGKLRALRPRGDGYVVVNLSAYNVVRVVYVHTLVLEAFVGSCPAGMEACHDDNNRANNVLSNLRWDTPVANQEDRKRHGTYICGEQVFGVKLTADQVRQIRNLRAVVPSSRVAEGFGVSRSLVKAVWNRRVWKHV